MAEGWKHGGGEARTTCIASKMAARGLCASAAARSDEISPAEPPAITEWCADAGNPQSATRIHSPSCVWYAYACAFARVRQGKPLEVREIATTGEELERSTARASHCSTACMQRMAR